jgi:hypothetical protein
VSSFSARLYGQRRAKRKTEALIKARIKEFTDSEDADAIGGAASN